MIFIVFMDCIIFSLLFISIEVLPKWTDAWQVLFNWNLQYNYPKKYCYNYCDVDNNWFRGKMRLFNVQIIANAYLVLWKPLNFCHSWCPRSFFQDSIMIARNPICFDSRNNSFSKTPLYPKKEYLPNAIFWCIHISGRRTNNYLIWHAVKLP